MVRDTPVNSRCKDSGREHLSAAASGNRAPRVTRAYVPAAAWDGAQGGANL